MTWNTSHTLGGKQKEFKWQYSSTEGLRIKREFKNKIYDQTFTDDEMDKIIDYMNTKGKVFLANSVSKLGNGTEKDGLGKFVYEVLNRTVSDAQGVSQLVAVLYDRNVIKSNGKKIDMEFELIDEEWKSKLM